ncbi:MAG: hypothetical protein QM680_12750 [Luteolibacter sp.]
MNVRNFLLLLGLVVASFGCATVPWSEVSLQKADWEKAIDRQVQQLGYRNWIIIAEASYPAQNRPGIHQVTTDKEIPEVLDYVLQSMEQTENVRPRVYVTRELRSLENDFAPGIDGFRSKLKNSMHGHETTELDQQSLVTLTQDANRSFDVLVIRTPTALPYTSVFMELQPGYWDSDSESRLRQRIEKERMEKLAHP